MANLAALDSLLVVLRHPNDQRLIWS